MAIHHPSMSKQVEKYTATQIFEEFLPKVLEAQKDIAKQLNAVCVFKVDGKDGGTWTVDLPKQKVNHGDHDHPDMRLELSADDFDALLAGKLDAAEAVKAKRLFFTGRPQLLVGMAALLRPADNN
ncbi:MAG: SCP2 sterol-binding domain-containing protein [Deltaproteobacteria bacterium]|nr:SCP2 sterol-binding domain-containing protein [Deltaproteobacteria bacterium]